MQVGHIVGHFISTCVMLLSIRINCLSNTCCKLWKLKKHSHFSYLDLLKYIEMLWTKSTQTVFTSVLTFQRFSKA